MTVRKGESWGVVGGIPDDGVVVMNDRMARTLVEDALRAGRTPPVLGLAGGDMCRTLGGEGRSRLVGGGGAGRTPTDAAMRFSLDVGVATIEGERHWFVAHLVARRSWWRGRIVAVMNAEWLGQWDVAPRAHPNDGLLDIVDADLSFDDRLKARRRLPAGMHVPHPGIHVARTAEIALQFERPLDVWLDGERVTRTTAVDVAVVPDAIVGVV